MPDNPFNKDNNPERHGIWEFLVRKDSEAFAAADWARVEGDFDAQRFEGINGNSSADPDDWDLKFHSLEAYRDAWLAMAAEFNQLPFESVTPLEYLMSLSHLNEIEIQGDRALCYKKFYGDSQMKDGSTHTIRGQTVYRLHRIDGKWKIVGFIGYLPYGGK